VSQSVAATIDGLYAAVSELYGATVTSDGAPVLVTVGPPGQYQPFGLVAVATQSRLPVTRPTMGTGRSREITAEVDSIISIYVPGGDEAAQPAIDQATELLRMLEDYFRTAPNETLNGGCREAFVSGSSMTTSVAYQTFDDPTAAPVPTGRVAEITVTVTAYIRR
jgi:hypothetical protein